jgi:hypothetical protein
MSNRQILFGLALILFVALNGMAWAGGGSIRGTVLGTDGKPLAGAEVRAEKADGKGAAAVAKTDAKGQYSLNGLGVGMYKVTAVVNNVPKSVAAVGTRDKRWAQADFNLSLTANKSAQLAKKKKRYVWVPGDTGSHIGGGHWEAVEDAATGTGASATERIDGNALRVPNSVLSPAAGVSGPGH